MNSKQINVHAIPQALPPGPWSLSPAMTLPIADPEGARPLTAFEKEARMGEIIGFFRGRYVRWYSELFRRVTEPGGMVSPGAVLALNNSLMKPGIFTFPKKYTDDKAAAQSMLWLIRKCDVFALKSLSAAGRVERLAAACEIKDRVKIQEIMDELPDGNRNLLRLIFHFFHRIAESQSSVFQDYEEGVAILVKKLTPYCIGRVESGTAIISELIKIGSGAFPEGSFIDV